MMLRILVVEDEFLVALDVEAMLAALGCEVIGPAATVDQAIALIASERVDGALLDINVAGNPVFPVADRLAVRGIPFAFATGYDAESVLPDHFADRPVLRKPYDEEHLADLVHRMFELAPA